MIRILLVKFFLKLSKLIKKLIINRFNITSIPMKIGAIKDTDRGK